MFFFPFKDDNPTNTKPFISWFLIAICSFVFIYQMGLSTIDFNNFVRFFGITPTNFLNNIIPKTKIVKQRVSQPTKEKGPQNKPSIIKPTKPIKPLQNKQIEY